ncbi:MAG: D-glycerate dehydrogenase [Hyphomonadaceae bacterium]|nr:D-glycerate dehydrogenase [Hyphomonadaceae bacterium]
MAKALLTCRHLQKHFPAFKPQYDALGVEARVPGFEGQQLDTAAMRALIADVDAVIAGDDAIDASVIEAGKAGRLKAIIKWGVGTDSIDKAAAARLGVPVFNTPGVFADEVADLAMALLLGVVRRTHLMNSAIRAGAWTRLEGRTLAGKTAGVIGLGSIGQGIARRVQAFGMRAIGYDVRALAAGEAPGVRQAPLDAVLRESDAVLLACNLTAENRHMLNEAALAAMKPGVVIVNVSRGPLIDEAALAAALASGAVAGAGLDVFEAEPLPADSPLRAFDQCVFTAHAGSSTEEAIARINQMTSDILFHVLGKKPDLGFTPNRVA